MDKNSNMELIYKDRVCLKLCFTYFGHVRSRKTILLLFLLFYVLLIKYRLIMTKETDRDVFREFLFSGLNIYENTGM